jgi:cytochrome c
MVERYEAKISVRTPQPLVIGLAVGLAFPSAPTWGAGDAERGVGVFRQCAACHSTTTGVHLTGPSLANIWHHKAATVPGFVRYSDAMKQANIVWNDETLNKWLANPESLVRGTSMTFPGLPDAAAREDVIAYLKAVAHGNAPSASQRGGGMMAQPARPDLKQAPSQGQVVAIRHCADSYAIKTADGKRSKIWEFNLRFKTDTSSLGPQRGNPVVVGAGMQGDRASVVFATPGEISDFVKESCDGF